MFHKPLAKSIFYIILFLLLSIAAFSLCYIFQTYDIFLIKILAIAKKQYLIEAIKKSYFTQNNFKATKYVAFCILFASSYFTYYLLRNQAVTIDYLNHIIENYKNKYVTIIKVFNDISTIQKVILTSILLLIFIKNIFTSNLQILDFDEAWNFKYYLNQPIYLNFLSHNNYPLNNIVTKIFISIFGKSDIVMRLYSNVMAIAGALAIFYITKSVFKRFDMAIAAIIVFIFTPVLLTYCAISKGIVSHFVFLIPIYYLVIKYFKQNGFTNFQWINFTILNLLATLSSISHCSFMVTINIAILIVTFIKQKNKIIDTIKKLFFYSFISIVPIIPFLFVNNFSESDVNMFDNFYKTFFQAFKGYSSFIFFNWYAVLLVLIINIYILFVHKEAFAGLNFFIFLLPITVSLLFKYLLVDRFFYYILIIQFSSFIYLLFLIKNKFIFYSVILIYVISAIYNFNYKFQNIFSKQYDVETKLITKKINENKYNSILFSSSTYVYPNLAIEYYSKLKNPYFTVNLNIKNSSRFDSFENHQLYPLIIVDTNKYQKIENFQRVAILSGEAELWEKIK